MGSNEVYDAGAGVLLLSVVALAKANALSKVRTSLAIYER